MIIFALVTTSCMTRPSDGGREGGRGERDTNCCHPSSPVVSCRHPLSPVAARRHSLLPVVTRSDPSSTDVIRRQTRNPSYPSSSPSPYPFPLPSPPPFLENTLITGKNLINSVVLFSQKFLSSPNIIQFLSFIK